MQRPSKRRQHSVIKIRNKRSRKLEQARSGNNYRSGPKSKRLPANPLEEPQRLSVAADLLREVELIGLVTLDRLGRIHSINQTCARMLGFPSDWLRNRSFLVFVARNDIDTLLKALLTCARQRERRIIEIDLAVGHQTIPAMVALRSIVHSDIIAFQLEILDLTEIRKTEIQLRHVIEEWHSFLLSAPDVIAKIDSAGRFTFLNRSLWGYSIVALIGTRIYDYVRGKGRDELRRCLKRSFKYQGTQTCQVRFKSKDCISWFSLTFGTARMYEVEQKTTTTVVIREISESKRAEEMLQASTDQLRNLAARIQAAREEERTHLAREIHDELGQALTVLKLDLSAITRMEQASNVRRKLEGTIALTDNIIQRVRSISSELRPAILDHFGIQAAIEWQAAQLRKRAGIRISLESDSQNIELSPDASVAAFRVVQEALTNVVRHAAASRVQIRMNATDSRLHISISDNGRGLSQDRLTHVESLGILGMKERITRLGGNFQISSLPAKGTRVGFDIPIQQKPEE